MATASVTAVRSSFMRPKYLIFAFVGLMVAYVLNHKETFLIHANDPVWQHYQPFKWWLLPHGIAGEPQGTAKGRSRPLARKKKTPYPVGGGTRSTLRKC